MKENRKCRSDVVCSLAGVVRYTTCQYIILQCAIGDSFQTKMGRGDFVNANDINWHIPISWVNENRNTFRLLGIIKTSYIIIDLLQTPNQNFENNIIIIIIIIQLVTRHMSMKTYQI